MMAALFSVLAAGLALAAEPCPPGMACSENYEMRIPQTAKQPVIKDGGDTAATVAAYQKAVAEARERDLDKTVLYIKTSQTDTCLYWELDRKVDELLMKDPTVIIDRKEFLAPAFSIEKISRYDGKSYNKCTVTLVVHYHKTGGDEK